MADYNLVILVGRLTGDPELKYTAGDGTPFTNLSLAVNRVTTDANGSSEKSVLHIDVAVWRHQAELCCQFVRRGSNLLVSGFLEQVRWTDARDAKRSKLRVRAQRIQFLDRAKSHEQPAADAAAS